MNFSIDPKDLNLQDAAGMQLVEVIRKLADESGTTDYEDLDNLPKINGVTLKGNKSSADLDIVVDYEDLDNLPKINGVTLVGDKTTADLDITPTDAQVETAVNAWLGSNVDPETGYVLDSTLTMSNAAAPADKVGEIKDDVDDLNDAVYTEVNVINSLINGGTNTAVTNNNDGTYTIGTGDYGNTWFGSPVYLAAGNYLLFGVPAGFSWVNTTNSHNSAIATNDTNVEKEITIAEAGDYYVGFRVSSAPAESFTITPYLNKVVAKADNNTAEIEVLKKPYYIMTPTGDTTDRKAEIQAALVNHKYVFFPDGDYYINTRLDLPSGSRLSGVGKGSKLIYGSNATGSMIMCGNDCQISNLMLDGGAESKPDDAQTNRKGIYIYDNAQTLQMHDCWIVGFGGYGVYVVDTGYGQLSSVQIENCYFRYNGIGVFFDQKGEYGLISNCSFIDNYTGALVKGGNNIFSGCALERNTIGALVNGSGIENSGHGAFVGCSFNHNTSNGLQIINTGNGYVVNGCQMFLNDVDDLNVNSSGVNVSGCNFGNSADITISENSVILITNNMFSSQPTLSILEGAVVKGMNNFTFAGSPVVALNTL